MEYFAHHLRPGQQTSLSLRASQYKHSIKRKRDEGSEEPPDGLDDDAAHLSASPYAQSFAPSNALEAGQLRVAGLLPDDAFIFPPPPFPHGPGRQSKDYFSYSKVQKEIASLHPAVYAAGATSKSQPVRGESEQPALRKTHLQILSTIMHRCLFEGDYERAARAWGMILRTQVAGHPIDPRYHERWGIGAELLLRQNTTRPSKHVQDDDDDHHHHHHQINEHANEQSLDDNDDIFTEEGLELGRDYYERLIVQYPNRKGHAHAIDDRTFYPPLFSVWIMSILEKSKHARKQLQREHHSPPASVSTWDDSTNISDMHARESVIRADELVRAKELCARLDQLLLSPPFDKHAELLRLRGNVGLWISDLLEGNWARGEQEHWDASNIDHDADNNHKYADCLRELERAEYFFARAEANGESGLSETKSKVAVKMRELTIRQH